MQFWTRKRLLFCGLLLLNLPLEAQVYSDVVTNSRGQPVAGASYAVYTNPGNTSCSSITGTLITLYTDPSTSVPCTGSNGCNNPMTSDSLGRVLIYAAPGIYCTQITGYQLGTYQYPIQVGGGGGGSGTITGSGTAANYAGFTASTAVGNAPATYSGSATTFLGVPTAPTYITNGPGAAQDTLSCGTLQAEGGAGTVDISAPASCTHFRWKFPTAPPLAGQAVLASSISGTDAQIGFGTLGTTYGGTNLDSHASTGVAVISSGTWSAGRAGAAYGGTNIDSSASTGVAQVSSGTWSVATSLPNGTTVATPSASDNTTKVATTAFVQTAISGGIKRTLTTITANGAIDPHTPANYIFTKAGVAAMTLAAPTVTTDDGVTMCFTNTTTDQDTITATGLFQDGAATTDLATWPAHAGATLCIMGYQGKWLVLSNNAVTIT